MDDDPTTRITRITVVSYGELQKENTDLRRAIEWMWKNATGWGFSSNPNRGMPDDIRSIIEKVVNK